MQERELYQSKVPLRDSAVRFDQRQCGKPIMQVSRLSLQVAARIRTGSQQAHPGALNWLAEQGVLTAASRADYPCLCNSAAPTGRE